MAYLRWYRPRDIFGEYELFRGINPGDIEQGYLSDCYFLASVSALAEWTTRVDHLFEQRRKNDVGCYGVNLYIMGQRLEMVVDDLIPCWQAR